MRKPCFLEVARTTLANTNPVTRGYLPPVPTPPGHPTSVPVLATTSTKKSDKNVRAFFSGPYNFKGLLEG